MSRIVFPRYWKLFCERKSIPLDDLTPEGLKITIENYIANIDDYYSRPQSSAVLFWDSWRDQYREDYKCKYCNEVISLEGNKCSNCGEIAPICVVCFGDPEPKESIAVLMCCGSYVHVNHIDTWMETNDICPNCQKKYPDIRKVKNEFQ